MEKRSYCFKDRKDGYYLKNIDAMHKIMPYLMPKRTATEACLIEKIDLMNMEKYLHEKNLQNPEHKYTIFHVIAAALAKTAVLRPKLCRFISGHRMYEYKKLNLSFVVKEKFEDNAKEGLAFVNFDKSATIETIRSGIFEKVDIIKSDKKDNSTNIMDKVAKFPRWLLKIITTILKCLDYYGWVPDFIIKEDPSHAGIFIANLGSIGLKANYHHLNDWGTNSFFVVIGEKYNEMYYKEEGTVELRPTLDLAITIDERIADGYYYAKSIKLLKYLLQNPQLLELPANQEVAYDAKQ